MFTLQSNYQPTGDQPKAIEEIVQYLEAGHKYQTLWGVTGSGKTFTMANVIQKVQKPTLIIAHNKTLAAQLAQEFKEFFPGNAVHYFVSYYDYYQPEAYIQKTDTYIEKEATINEEIDRLRHAATQDLLTRKDVIIVASVSCIYGIGDVSSYTEQVFDVVVGAMYPMETLLTQLVALQYRRAGADFKPGMFQVMGDILEIFPASSETVYTIEFWGEEVSQITRRNYLTGEIYEYLQEITVFPAKHTVTTKDNVARVVPLIQEELKNRLEYYESVGDVLKHERLKTKVEYDLEMLQEVGYVNGIENYSRYLDGRKSGEAPYTLLDYFGDDYLCFIDESHMTISQVGGMYEGDRSRKQNLVDNGFRLPSALDNRPLKFPEFESKLQQVICVSATPGKYEIGQSCQFHPEYSGSGKGKNTNNDSVTSTEGQNNSSKFFNFNPIQDGAWVSSHECRVVPQVIRPTGLLDPIIELQPMQYMVDDIMKNISEVIERNERMLITTITKRSSEELSDYLLENGVKARYLHSEIDTLERLEILKDLRTGKIDVLVGVNLLREGLDLPEVSCIGILDADKQGFLRSESSLIQIIGRAARNSRGRVVMYVERIRDSLIKSGKLKVESDGQPSAGLIGLDKGKWCREDGLVVSEAMRKAILLTNYRRNLQHEYNTQNGITPTTVYSSIKDMGVSHKAKKDYAVLDQKSVEKEIARLELEMDIAAANMEYEQAAELRDQIIELKKGKKRK